MQGDPKVIEYLNKGLRHELPAVPIIAHPRPQTGAFSSCPSHENSAQAEPSRAP